ncbi:N-(5'-phosphoribosyl)anthranilate isomerase [Flavobacteriales bacterium 34_180_T64]|nr:N-(5'-phosphoribosyl)anthranilate isomerase [Flavobacteriales bacterium 34_180_T64]
MKLKVCGMKYPENMIQVAALQPDYLGFIFYENSSRYFKGTIPELSDSVKKIGVFVDASIEYIRATVKQFNLQLIQLHGNESPEFCKELDQPDLKIIKVFSIQDEFNFNILKPYEDVCDYFLFDTKGKLPGGNGYVFNWNILNNYPSSKPFFLSGGIGLDQIDNLKHFKNSKVSKYCHAIDVNSKFEIEAGLKDINTLEKFKNNIITRSETTK